MTYKLDKVRLLIIDDMVPMLTLTKSVLGIFGFDNIVTADNGEEGFEKVCRHDPDLIITDWMMEPVNGLEFTKMVRRSPLAPNPYVPIIMMTGFSSRLRVENARDIGVTEFLVKPFTSRDLYNRVTQIIEKPRQFVDTGEFFGPDRRRKRAKDYEGPRRRQDDSAKTAKGEPSKQISDILRKLREEARHVSDKS